MNSVLQIGVFANFALDAITWAVWGKARAKRDDELIHLGQGEMEVEYTFGLGEDVYRIIRKRDSSRRGRSDLSFQIEDAGGWRTLTETSVRATQQKINTVLRLDYDTFINSAFLLQGRADEFTTKTASKRKEILGDILGLGLYDTYEDRAKKLANEKEKEGTAIIAKVEQIELELARETEYRTELAVAQQEANTLNKQLLTAEKEMDTLREQHRALNDKQRQLDDLQSRLSDSERDIADSAEAMATSTETIERYQQTLTRRGEIEGGLQAYQAAQATVSDWGQRLQASVKLSDQKHELDTAFNAAQAEIEAKLREITTTINLLAPKVAAAESQQEQLKGAQDDLHDLQTILEERDLNLKKQTDYKEEGARLREQNKQLKIEMEDIKANLNQLKEAGSNCPVCQQVLDETHQVEVLAQFEQEGTTKGDAYRSNQTRLRTLAQDQETLQQQITEADKQRSRLSAVQGRVAKLEQILSEAETAAADLQTAKNNQADLQTQIDQKTFAVDVLAALDEVKNDLAALGYDESAHQAAQKEAESLKHFETEHRALEEATKRLSNEEKRFEREKSRHERLSAQTAKDRERIAELEVETAGFAELSLKLNKASNDVSQLQREERLARDKVAAANQKLGHIAYMAKQRSEQESKLEKIRSTTSIYRDLQLAFGKKGVQALLIESAIPEIEEEANSLLSRMTDSRMTIRFETQRAAKSSENTIETLDIRISDELGTRDYEMYSGGEAFRVNFAIRVAMSKILARRAGAQLQTLVIDEGFGTQDGQGRERLVEAINAIQKDFEKIIIITHLEELKEAFPARIDVWKTSDGSHISIR
ncbi:MAG: SMC family ATPase [Chloroflexota bacterium]